MSREILFRGKWAVYAEIPKYGVSEDGRVCSFDYNHSGKTVELNQYSDKDGYKYVFLTVNGKRYKRMVHRMVLSTFVKNERNLPQINHKDGNKENNNISNLEWCSARDNVLHAYRVLGRKHSSRQIEMIKSRSRGENNVKAKLSYKDVLEIRSEKVLSAKEMALKYRVSRCTIYSVLSKTTWKDAK